MKGSCNDQHHDDDAYHSGYGPAPGPPAPPSPAPPSPAPGGYLSATTLHWNSHRPCATSRGDCVAAAQKRLGEMAGEVGASIVGAVELKDGYKALPNWQSSGQQCDNSVVMVAPGWSITNSGGHCMGGDGNKGFAVALVTPPEQVAGCSALCVAMGHVPHPGHQIDGHDEIASVCGGAEQNCMIMMADWNIDDVSSPWGTLVGGSPVLNEPQELTCCYNTWCCRYDHTVTNIQGAYSEGYKVYDPQLTQFPSGDEHKPTSVQLMLPTGGFRTHI